MGLQNRVDPWSRVCFSEKRGAWMGNRGRLHDEGKQLVKQTWTLKGWVICELIYKDWKRELMQPKSYTELFFMDEAAALAAGHRPCAFCRREAYREYLDCVEMRSAKEVDERLHRERVGVHFQGEEVMAEVDSLPDGVMVERGGEAWLIWKGGLRKWGFGGYGERVKSEGRVRVLTPELSVKGLRGGYGVQVGL